VTTKEELEQVLRGTPVGSVDAICHVPSALVGAHIELLIQKAKVDKIPLVVTDSSMVKQGALVSYGADFRLLGAQAARLVAKVLKGAKPSEIPVQTPEKLVLVINLTTAKAIGLEIPRAIFERADLLLE
jgi:putative tryptophan/tyrosine transport system substrate-binding protein